MIAAQSVEAGEILANAEGARASKPSAFDV